MIYSSQTACMDAMWILHCSNAFAEPPFEHVQKKFPTFVLPRKIFNNIWPQKKQHLKPQPNQRTNEYKCAKIREVWRVAKLEVWRVFSEEKKINKNPLQQSIEVIADFVRLHKSIIVSHLVYLHEGSAHEYESITWNYDVNNDWRCFLYTVATNK